MDTDLNYIGALEREDMLADRPRIEQAAQAVFSREGFAVRRVPSEHAGGKWRLSYASFTGQPANIDVDFNFMYRQPLWEIHHADSQPLGDFQAKRIPILDLHELVAGKLSALFSRQHARPLRLPSRSRFGRTPARTAPHRLRRLRGHEPQGLADRLGGGCGLRQHGVGEATRPHLSRPPIARAGGIGGIRGAAS